MSKTSAEHDIGCGINSSELRLCDALAQLTEVWMTLYQQQFDWKHETEHQCAKPLKERHICGRFNATFLLYIGHHDWRANAGKGHVCLEPHGNRL